MPQQHRGGQGGGRQVRPGRDSAEPWSEVPPEVEELLRAQLSARAPRPSDEQAAREQAGREQAEAPVTEAAPKRRAPARKKAAADGEAAPAAETSGE